MVRRILILVVISCLAFCPAATAEDAATKAGGNTVGDLKSCYESVKKPGITSLKTEECQQAVEFYRKAIDARPDLPENYLSLARCFGFMGQFEMAIEYVDQAIVLAPNDWTAHMDKAMDYVALKRTKEAGPELHKALDLLNSQAGKLSDIQMVEGMIKRYGL